MRLWLTLLATTGAILGVALTQAAPISNTPLLTRNIEPARTVGISNTLTARAAAAAVDAVDSVYKRQEAQLDTRAPMTAGQGVEVVFTEATHLTPDIGTGAQAVHEADASSSLVAFGKEAESNGHQLANPSLKRLTTMPAYSAAKEKADASKRHYQIHEAAEPEMRELRELPKWTKWKLKSWMLRPAGWRDFRAYVAANEAHVREVEKVTHRYPNEFALKHLPLIRKVTNARIKHIKNGGSPDDGYVIV